MNLRNSREYRIVPIVIFILNSRMLHHLCHSKSLLYRRTTKTTRSISWKYQEQTHIAWLTQDTHVRTGREERGQQYHHFLLEKVWSTRVQGKQKSIRHNALLNAAIWTDWKLVQGNPRNASKVQRNLPNRLPAHNKVHELFQINYQHRKHLHPHNPSHRVAPTENRVERVIGLHMWEVQVEGSMQEHSWNQSKV